MDGPFPLQLRAIAVRITSLVLVAGLGHAGTADAAEAPNPHPTSRFVVSHPDLPATALRLRRPVTAALHGPEVHRYTLDLRRGQFASVRIPQLEGNLVAVVFDPDGELVAIVDENGAGQAEVATIVASKSGAYAVQLAVFEWDVPLVRYSIEWRLREPARSKPSERAAQLFRAWYEESSPGAVLVVRDEGRTAYADAIGLANAADKAPLTLRTPVDLASVSKQFTGYAVALLVDRRQLGLDDDVRRYLPELPDYGTTVTIRHLLEHTSGVRDWDGLFGLVGRRIEDGIDIDEVLAMLARQSALNFAPGSRQEYSNSNYVLLALVVERVTGQPFDTWMTRNVLQPLNLRECRLSRQRSHDAQEKNVPEQIANSYSASYVTPRLASSGSMQTLGSSALACSAHDLARWLDNYSTGSLGGDAVRALVAPTGAPPAEGAPRYVYGNWYSLRDGIEVVGHQGLAAGFRTSLHRFPSQRLEVIWLANDGNDANYPRVLAIENLFLGIAPPPVIAPDVNYTPAVAESLDAVTVAGYVGRYESPELPATYVIVPTGDGIAVQHERMGVTPLQRVGSDQFAANRDFLQGITFVRDAQGRVSGFTVHSEDVDGLLFRRVAAGPTPVDGG